MKISIQMKNHYKNCFNKYGPTSQGIDWGEDESKLLLRYEKMTNLFLANDYNEKFTLLDEVRFNLVLNSLKCGIPRK